MDDVELDAWGYSKLKQKPILDELEEFSSWYEKEYLKHCEENNIPIEEREDLGLKQMVEQAKLKEKQANDSVGIPCGNLSKQKQIKQELQE